MRRNRSASADIMKYVLAVDDDRLYVDAVTTLVAPLGYRVIHAGCLRDARRQLLLFPFTVALLATGLPDGEVAGLLSELQALQPAARVVWLTAYRDAASVSAPAGDNAARELLKTQCPADVIACLRATSA